MNERTVSDDVGALADGRARLAAGLLADGWAGAVVSEAFRAVPRHVFLPRESAARASRTANAGGRRAAGESREGRAVIW